MDVTAALDAEVEPGRLFSVLADLATYPQWLDIVGAAVPDDPRPGETGPAWTVDLRGQLGPFRRSKRLRMLRSVATPNEEVVFRRAELDGRSHSDWTLRATVAAPGAADAPATPVPLRLTMQLHYGGSLWVPLLDRLLADEVERSRPRLLALVGAAT